MRRLLVNSFVEDQEPGVTQISWRNAFGVDRLTQIDDPRLRDLAARVAEGDLLAFNVVCVQENDPVHVCERVPISKALWATGEGLQVLTDLIVKEELP
jgi:hypothetical protein